MARSYDQKKKTLLLERFLRENTDEDHEATMQEILDYLAENGISAERKSVYNDISTLEELGYDILRDSGPRGGYRLSSREFELSEVKLLVDLVQSSKFITKSKSQALIRKLETLVSRYQAKGLQRQVVVFDRNKNANENIYYSVDVIHEAIAGNRKIRFQYYEWGTDKKPHLRHGGAFYEVSPWLLTWDDENYYLVAYDEVAEKMKHYRVDKMQQASVSEDIRKGRALYDKIDIGAYTRKNFGMFSGTETTVQLLCAKGLAGVMIDRFGTDVAMRNFDEEYVLVRTDVEVSSQFFGWLSSFGGKVKVYGPARVAEEYCSYLQQILKAYEEDQGGK